MRGRICREPISREPTNCPGLESNQHALAGTWPSTMRVCLFRHPGCCITPSPRLDANQAKRRMLRLGGFTVNTRGRCRMMMKGVIGGKVYVQAECGLLGTRVDSTGALSWRSKCQYERAPALKRRQEGCEALLSNRSLPAPTQARIRLIEGGSLLTPSKRSLHSTIAGARTDLTAIASFCGWSERDRREGGR